MCGVKKIIFMVDPSGCPYDFRSSINNTIRFSPILVMIGSWILLYFPLTRGKMLFLLKENHPVEMLTFVFLLLGGFWGILLAVRSKKTGKDRLSTIFFAVFSIGLIFTAMEEIAWGQQFFSFETPALWKMINRQEETTFHNIVGLHTHSEMFRLTYGAGGLIGVWLSFRPRFKRIGAPSILLSWFLVISLHAGLDLYRDCFPFEKQFGFFMQRTSEVVELLIGISGFLYVLIHYMIPTINQKGHFEDEVVDYGTNASPRGKIIAIVEAPSRRAVSAKSNHKC